MQSLDAPSSSHPARSQRGRWRLASLLFVLSGLALTAATKDLGHGFADHGIAIPISNHRGTVVTVDGQGRDIVLLWLYDHSGGYALLMIDAETGKSEQYPMPFPPGGDGPFASILSSANRFYTHFNGYIAEFDPVKRAFTFHHKTKMQMAMGMTEDDNGVIWSVTYPNSGVVSYNPKTGEFKDYGYVYEQNWQQYQRYVVADDAGWIYIAVGNTKSQILAFDPSTGKAKPMLPEAERKTGSSYLFRDMNGKVYGQAVATGGDAGIFAKKEGASWYEFHKGVGQKIDALSSPKPKKIITSSQALFHTEFASGRKLKACNLVDRTITVLDPKTKQEKTVAIDYTSTGANIMGLLLAPDNTLTGGTMFPMRCFSFNPKADSWVHRAAYGQYNTIMRTGDRVFVGGYPGGFLLEWDASTPWVHTVKKPASGNPLFLRDCTPTIHRPHRLIAYPDGKTVILAGTPGYGYTGGGMMFWDRSTQTSVLLNHTDILPEHSTFTLLPLPEGKLFGGTTIGAGTGGEVKAKVAELYIMDMASKRLDWHEAIMPGVKQYTDSCFGPRGLIYGVADRKTFFVFDPVKRAIVHQENIEAKFGITASEQGPRIFVTGPKGEIYLLFAAGVARIAPENFAITLLAKSPHEITAGGDYFEGRLYFACGSHLCSYQLAP
ncbi:MAG: hypothetical protein HZA31_03225 [Opitutae bacterium]|nr:hypothetical protein [Opitutae bacterium]